MCRRNLLTGVAVIAFGVGLIVGGYISSGFWCGCAGVGIIAVGVLCIQRR